MIDDSMAPTLRMLDAILSHLETFFTEAGCPLTPAQQVVMGTAHQGLREQTADAA